MTLSLSHLPRYKDIAVLLWKYGRSDLVHRMGMDEAFDPAEGPPVTTTDPIDLDLMDLVVARAQAAEQAA